jgi:hypothetical protein
MPNKITAHHVSFAIRPGWFYDIMEGSYNAAVAMFNGPASDDLHDTG